MMIIMKRDVIISFAFVATCCIIAASATSTYIGPPLKFGFYKKTCPNFDKIVAERVAYYTKLDPTTPAPLLRLFFHDCFVQGCDASVLLNSTSKFTAEKDSDNNFSLSAFDVINDIKSHLEAACPAVVSCADILAAAAVNGLHEAGGPLYDIELGRRDALTSYALSAATFLPGATLNVDGLLENFATVGLDLTDLVALSGGHTIGQGHCSSIKNRIYPTVDKSYHPGYGQELLANCTLHGKLSAPNFDPNVQIFIDHQTQLKFDNAYFKGLQQGYGLFTSDNVLYADKRTQPLVNKFASNSNAFLKQFGLSLRKMGKIGVLTGTQGQIREKCWVRNSNNADSALNPQAKK